MCVCVCVLSQPAGWERYSGFSNSVVQCKKRLQCIACPLHARTQSLEATVYTRTIVFHHYS